MHKEIAKELWIFVGAIGIAILNFLTFGLGHARGWSDASEYFAYAVNLLSGHGYTMDGATFSALREPGYPFFLAFWFKLFGTQDLLAVCFIQALILGVLGYVVYRTFKEYAHPTAGVVAGACTAALPYYGLYSNEILTEMLFAFLIGLVFYTCSRILNRKTASWHLAALLGTLCGLTSLVRFQFVLFLPFAILLFLVSFRPYRKDILRDIIVAFVFFGAMLLPWTLYVHHEIGTYAVTEGRQAESLYARAMRSQLSYGELTRYAKEWMARSISGGTEGSGFLYTYEFKNLYLQYHSSATDASKVQQIRNENIRAILTHPGQYLYSSLIELIKLLYIEHDYSDSMNRYFRAGFYMIMYGLFAFGLMQLALHDGPLRTLGLLALSMLIYNYLVLSLFIDVIPRLNTPYHLFYISIGIIGLALFYDRKEIRKSSKT